jgi:hypothetical protein
MASLASPYVVNVSRENCELRRANEIILSLFKNCGYMTAEDAVDVVVGGRRSTHILMTHLLGAIANCSEVNCGCHLRREIEEKGFSHFAQGDGNLYSMLYEISERPEMCWCKTKKIKPCKHCDEDCASKAPALVVELDPPFSVDERVQARLDRHISRESNSHKHMRIHPGDRVSVCARRARHKHARRVVKRLLRDMGVKRVIVSPDELRKWRNWRD